MTKRRCTQGKLGAHQRVEMLHSLGLTPLQKTLNIKLNDPFIHGSQHPTLPMKTTPTKGPISGRSEGCPMSG